MMFRDFWMINVDFLDYWFNVNEYYWLGKEMIKEFGFFVCWWRKEEYCYLRMKVVCEFVFVRLSEDEVDD